MAVRRFIFIRHGKTQSNLERRYSGDPGEPLCAEGVSEAQALARGGVLPQPIDMVVSGVALRCRQTAEILFPGAAPAICPMAEIDFGIFKGKNAGELLGYKEYEQWLDTGCMGDIPGGDSVSAFRKRCCEAFLQIAEADDAVTTALIVHGGNIMAIMEHFAAPKQSFFEYRTPNCGFYFCRYENGALYVERRSATGNAANNSYSSAEAERGAKR